MGVGGLKFRIQGLEGLGVGGVGCRVFGGLGFKGFWVAVLVVLLLLLGTLPLCFCLLHFSVNFFQEMEIRVLPITNWYSSSLGITLHMAEL